TQQIHAGDSQQLGEGDVFYGEIVLQHDSCQKRGRISHNQANVALDSAVAPNLPIDIGQHSCGENAQETHDSLRQDSPGGHIPPRQDQHQPVNDQEHEKIVPNELPANFYVFTHDLFLFQSEWVFLWYAINKMKATEVHAGGSAG